MSHISLMQIEAAINYWRLQSPSAGEDLRLCPQASALAQPYAMMIMARRHAIASDELGPAAMLAWDAYRLSDGGEIDAGQ